MKKLLLVCFCLFGIYFAQAQAQIETGDKKVQIGLRPYGLGTGLAGQFDYGLNSMFSVGVGADFYFTKNENFYLYGRGNFHLGDLIGFDENFDLYPGIDLGITNSGFSIHGRLGARYFFTDKFGAFLEVGNHGVLGVCINL